jgi:hypothetical protein
MTATRARVLTTAGTRPEIVQALDTPRGIEFVDTHGQRHPAATIVTYWALLDTEKAA